MLRSLSLALALTAAVPAMATEYTYHIDKTITIDTAPDTEGELTKALYDAFQRLSYCDISMQVDGAQGIYVPLKAVAGAALFLLRPVSEDYTLYTPATKEVEDNARHGILELSKSYHYSLFDAKIASTKAQIPVCSNQADALKSAFDNYLHWRVSQVQAGK